MMTRGETRALSRQLGRAKGVAMGKTMPKITPQDTDAHFIGSGALDWPWWQDIVLHGIDYPDSADDWSVTVAEWDDDGPTGRKHTFNHADIMKAVRRIASGKVPYLVPGKSIAVRECRTLIFKGPDECDFDACSADVVLQVAAFGEVIYG